VLFSPDGRFLFFSVRYYEAEGAFYTDLSSRKTVELTGLAYATRAETDDSPLALYWSLDGSRMALQSYGSAIGYGNNALYVSPTGHPKDLVPIFTFNETPVIDGTNQPVVKAINDLLVTRETVTFTAFFSAGGSTRFVYTFATNALEKQDRAR
jgi:hypothetical protein